MRFYLTDEECKYGHNLATGNINLCFYLTDEECKWVKHTVDSLAVASFYLTDEECKFNSSANLADGKLVFI